MPPMPSESDESDGLDTIPARIPKEIPKRVEDFGQDMEVENLTEENHKNGDETADKDAGDAVAKGDNDAEDEDEADGEDGDDDNAETYIVEKIIAHGFDDSDGHVIYKVKWVGYDKESEHTWESYENLANGAQDVLAKYNKKIGGRPEPQLPKKKGGRPSGVKGKRKMSETAESPAPETKSKKTRRSTGNNKAWTMPDGDWEDRITTITTIQEGSVKNTKGQPMKGLVVYVTFNDGHRATFPLTMVRQKAPQKLLDYFEQHLSFKEPSTKETEDMATFESGEAQ